MKYEYEDIDPNTRIYNINGEKRKFKYVFYDAMLTLKFYPDTVYESIDEVRKDAKAKFGNLITEVFRQFAAYCWKPEQADLEVEFNGFEEAEGHEDIFDIRKDLFFTPLGNGKWEIGINIMPLLIKFEGYIDEQYKLHDFTINEKFFMFIKTLGNKIKVEEDGLVLFDMG